MHINYKPSLAYLTHLPEVGALRLLAERERVLLAQLKTVADAIEATRREATEQVKQHYSVTERFQAMEDAGYFG